MSSRRRLTKYHGQSDAQVYPADNPTTAKPHARKDTRRWCRGKVGREHQLGLVKEGYGADSPCSTYKRSWDALFKRSPLDWGCNHRRVCLECGKVMDHILEHGECPEKNP